MSVVGYIYYEASFGLCDLGGGEEAFGGGSGEDALKGDCGGELGVALACDDVGAVGPHFEGGSGGGGKVDGAFGEAVDLLFYIYCFMFDESIPFVKNLMYTTNIMY